ncbi:MAG: hypothetical protein U9R15_19625 [Chloroflexota bacterium]|nr:hypothetical protein [Chloroflexota bacterium]
MAVTVTWYEFNGSDTPENSEGELVATINFGNADEADLNPADYPIPAGSNSFFKQLIINISGSYTTINNMKLYKAAGNYKEGESIQFSGSVAASTPTIIDQGDPAIPTSIPAANNVAPYGLTTADSLPLSSEVESSPGYYSGSRTSLMRFQLLSTAEAPAGMVNMKTFSFTYDRT